jgi:acyl-CoA thioesterase-1
MLYSWAIYHIASGQAFFSGTTLILLAALSAFLTRGRWQAICRAILTCAGLVLIAVSSTPLPIWLYGVAGVVTLGWIAVQSSSKTMIWRSARLMASAVLAVWFAAIGFELPFHLMPVLPAIGNSPLFLIGDSLSAGIGGNIETWPKLFARRYHIDLRDL